MDKKALEVLLGKHNVTFGNDTEYRLDCAENISTTDCLDTIIKMQIKQTLNENLSMKIILGILYGILFLVGVIGNMTVILCIILFPFMRSITNMFLLNLAISDLFVFVICLPFTIGHNLYPIGLYSDAICKLQPVFMGVSVSVSIFSLVSISIERFTIVHNPLTYKLRFDRWRVIVWIIAMWVISISICTPLYFGQTITNDRWNYCSESWGNKTIYKKVYTMVFFFLLYLFPITFMGFVYLKLSKRLWMISNQICQTSSNRHQLSQRRKLSIVLISLFITFAVCWMPYHSINIIFDFCPQTDILKFVQKYAFSIAQFLCYSNSAIDPFCSLLLSAKFRVCLQRMRQGKCCPRRGQRGYHQGFLLQANLSPRVKMEAVVRINANNNQVKANKGAVLGGGSNVKADCGSHSGKNDADNTPTFEFKYMKVNFSNDRVYSLKCNKSRHGTDENHVTI